MEYYNNLPYHRPPRNHPNKDNNEPPADKVEDVPVEDESGKNNQKNDDEANTQQQHLAILVDPIIATGGTAAAAIQTLKEWGVTRIVLIAVLGSLQGVCRAAEEWEDAVEIWIAGVDDEIDARGMLRPGLGDVGDRLFLTVGK